MLCRDLSINIFQNASFLLKNGKNRLGAGGSRLQTLISLRPLGISPTDPQVNLLLINLGPRTFNFCSSVFGT